MPEILTIVRAIYAGDYSIVAEFSNGETKLLDFTHIVSSGKGLCHLLADKEYFQNFTLDPFTIDWNNEIGFDPEFLYQMGKPLPRYRVEEMEPDMVAEDINH